MIHASPQFGERALQEFVELQFCVRISSTHPETQKGKNYLPMVGMAGNSVEPAFCQDPLENFRNDLSVIHTR